ncbi:MAG: dTDP-4-dehydrorhamnose 3,5-epimerase [Leeuwenhoekiella sp.]
MIIQHTPIEGCFRIKPKIHSDQRGYFFECFNKHRFEEQTGVRTDFVQDNQSYSQRGVLRGLHLQEGDHAQAKLVTVLEGEVLDVAVDLRKGSDSFGKVFTTLLSGIDKSQLFIPRGCAHGFVVLSNTATFFYKCDNYYHKDSEAGIIYNDPKLKIDWHLPKEELILSEKDLLLPSFEDYTGKLSTT